MKSNIRLWTLLAVNGFLFLFSANGDAVASQAEVVIVSTEHFLTDQIGDTSPAHLRAMLNRIRPDLLALEAPVGSSDPFSQAPFECATVTLPWARAKGVPFYAVDEIAPDYQQRLAAFVQSIMSGPHGSELQLMDTQVNAGISKLRSFTAQQQPAYHEICRNYWAQIHRWGGATTSWDERGEKIAANTVKLAKAHAGKRIALIFGAMHGHDLQDRLKLESTVKLLPAEDFLPTAAEIEASASPEDDILALRRLNFPHGSPMVGNLDGIEKHIDRLASRNESEPTAIHYRARLLMHRAQWHEALKVLDAAASQPKSVKLAIYGQPPAALVAKLNRAIVLQVLQRNDEACAELDLLLADPGTQGDEREMAKQLRQSMKPIANPSPPTDP